MKLDAIPLAPEPGRTISRDEFIKQWITHNCDELHIKHTPDGVFICADPANGVPATEVVPIPGACSCGHKRCTGWGMVPRLDIN